MLSRGQTIEHEFRLLNPTARPVRILGAQALAPCCSEIATIPASIPARGEARLSVRFKPGFQSGRKAVAFRVKTDRAEEPVSVYTLRSDLVSEVQVAAIEGQGLSLLMGESGRQTLRIVARRYRDQGRGAPDAIGGAETTKARFAGEWREQVREDGVVESTRDVVVDIPPSHEAGSKSLGLAFRWADGRTWDYVVHWTVAPHLRVAPEALIVGHGDAPVKSVLVRSQTSPFRVLGIEGAGTELDASGAPLDRAANTHVVRLAFDRSRPRASGPFDVTIRTDHPEQPRVVVSVLMVPPERQGGP